jgi:hypothetical protein
LVVVKKEAAEKFCKQHDLTYELIDPGMLSHAEIKSLHDSRLLIFLPRYETKYQEYIK